MPELLNCKTHCVRTDAVTADKVFAVWVDEDAKANADKVVVNGALMKVEGDNAVIGAASTDELANADIQNNATIYLAADDYIIPSSAKGKTLTIKGTGNPEDVKVAVTKVGTGGENCDYGLDGSTVTFEGITITTNSSTYIGYARCNGTYKNCIINGTYTLYGNSIFENCTFNVFGDTYNIWTWGAPEATFTGCTFNSDGKAMLLYGERNTKLTMNNCVFNDNGGLTEKKLQLKSVLTTVAPVILLLTMLLLMVTKSMTRVSTQVLPFGVTKIVCLRNCSML